MDNQYIGYIPETLQEDFIENRVIPIVGAGFSKNAILPAGRSMPDWNELGLKISGYLPGHKYHNALRALSLYEDKYSRVNLVELLAKELYINEIAPGETHRAFCDIAFDVIVTTNFDFLIEHTLREKQHPYATVISPERLAIDTHERTKLIKLHGDFDHPEKMIITENDFDTFLEKNKVLSTFVANLFITKTLLLIGYSFDDDDVRNLRQIINSRLGRFCRPVYTIIVDATYDETDVFRQRNVKVINLPGKKTDYPAILKNLFTEIKGLNRDQHKRQTL